MAHATIVLTSDLSKKVSKELATHSLSMPDRLLNAINDSILYLVIAVLALAIPALHLVLTPIFTWIGISKFIHALNQDLVIEGIDFHCLNCQQRFSLRDHRLQWPMRADCPHCMARYKIESE